MRVPTDSFVTQYLSFRANSSVWTEATEDDQERALKTATLLIETCYSFRPEAVVDDDPDTGQYCEAVNHGIVEQAIHLLRMDPTLYPTALVQGLASGGASGASATFDRKMVAPFICEAAKRFLGPYTDSRLEDDEVFTTALW